MPDLSTVLAPADAAVWTKPDGQANAKPQPQAGHICTDACRPYRGPIRLGRRGETITPGRTT